jgi:hypothetical protein
MADSPFSPRDQQAVDWLLKSPEPGIVMQTRRDLLGERIPIEPAAVLTGYAGGALIEGQGADGGFGVHPYAKWMGAHWRLIELADLGVVGDETHARAAVEPVLGWLLGKPHLAGIKTIDGRTRRCASQEGNALAVCVRIGLHNDPRVTQLVDSLIKWQWPAGGWNCDLAPRVTHPSVHESLPPMWGLGEYASATGNTRAREAGDRAAEFFLDHRVYKSHRTGAPGNFRWLRIHYPTYWHYDVLLGLHALALVGRLPDRRADDALVLLREKQNRDGRWRPEGSAYWRRSGDAYRDPVDWSGDLATQMLTLRALRVLRAAGA